MNETWGSVRALGPQLPSHQSYTAGAEMAAPPQRAGLLQSQGQQVWQSRLREMNLASFREQNHRAYRVNLTA